MIRRAFTLIELLVVIGIIAVLLSILIPVVGRVREQGVTTKCAANLRQIHLALTAYAAENKGSLPWGWVWEHASPTGDWSGPGDERFSNWATTISRFMNVKGPQLEIAGNYTTGEYYGAYSDAFRCPAVDGMFEQRVTYTALTTAMPDWWYEINGFVPGAPGVDQPGQLRPAKMSDLYSDNTLIWDSPTWLFLKPSQFGESASLPLSPCFSYIDDGLLLQPRIREYRFRDKSYDPFMDVDPHHTQGLPIDIFAKNADPNTNTDAASEDLGNVQIGTPRFRHNRERACNAVFADGSVRTFTADFRTPRKGKAYDDDRYVETDWLRRYIMIKYPN